MRTVFLSVLIPLLLLGATPAVAQLPPEIQADSYLLRAQQAIDESDPARALVELDKIILLQKEHELDLPDEFHFRYAKAAAAAGLPEQALDAVVKYLTLAGREGRHYEEALELMNKAQDAIDGSKGLQAASNEQPPPAQAAGHGPVEAQVDAGGFPEAQEEKQTSLKADGTSEIQAEQEPESAHGTSARGVDCEQWGTSYYFKKATAANVRACLEEGSDPMKRDAEAFTPLHRAAESSEHPEVIQALVAAGGDPRARNQLGRTPLQQATEKSEHPEVVQVLVASEASLESRRSSGGAESCKNWNKAKFFAVKGITTFDTYGTKGSRKIVACLESGADLMARDRYGRTPLHFAARRLEAAETLLDYGADPMARDYEGRTPLHRAGSKVVETLLATGADLEARDEKGRTPLHLATWNGQLRTVEALLAAGADRMAGDSAGQTPLHLAAGKHFYSEGMFHGNSLGALFGQLTKALLAAGADLEARGQRGPHSPAYCGHRNRRRQKYQCLVSCRR